MIRGSEVADALNQVSNGFANDVANLIAVDGPTDIYSAVVSSQFDADRLDYIQRDPLMTGTQHSRIDFTWLLSNLEIGSVRTGVDEEALGTQDTFVLNDKAFYAAETYVLGLFHLYPAVYFHKATRSAEKLFTQLLLRLYSLIVNDCVDHTGLESNHPLVRFFIEPNQESFLPMDDFLIWGSIHQMVDAKDSGLADIATRLRDRKLLKCIDVRTEVTNRLPKNIDEALIDACCDEFDAAIEEWNEEQQTIAPRIIVDRGKRPTYQRFSEGKGPLNRIHVNKHGTLVDVSEVSKAVEASGTFKFLRAYFDCEDNQAKSHAEQMINNVVQGAVQ